MDFQDLGKYCSVKVCKQKDFLPFNCNKCAKHFCLKHYKTESHDCKEIAITKITDTTSFKNMYKCEKDKCKKYEIIELKCKYCNKNMCINHRLQQDHICSTSKSFNLFEKL